ncbi:MAG: DsrE family protein [Halothiobacillus sp.]
MSHFRKRAAIAALMVALMSSAPSVMANPAAEPVSQAVQDKPFAVARVALQISDGGGDKQQLVLNVAGNLLKFYGADKIDIEVVAFGPGLRLLFKNNALEDQIQSLSAEGVRFSACDNTIAAMTKILGHAPELSPVAKIVPAGIVRLVELNKAGYFIARP